MSRPPQGTRRLGPVLSRPERRRSGGWSRPRAGEFVTSLESVSDQKVWDLKFGHELKVLGHGPVLTSETWSGVWIYDGVWDPPL